MQSIALRLAECGLTMHPEKSKIVYCKDSNRTKPYPHVNFTFLGFTFRPRKALSKHRRIFTSFLPGVSADALKRLRQTVRGWKLNRQTHVTLAALATQYNPIIQGWWNYYGAFYQTAMLHVYQHIDRALERWARRKYKALSGRTRGGVQWLRKMKDAEPQLFHHWREVGTMVG
jgi:RNA-directed DNA polymerase